MSQLIWITLPVVLIYKGELTGLDLVGKLCNLIGLFLILCLIAMSLLHIFELQNKLRDLNVENIKLLDGMHEGLLIMSKSNKNVIFCNRPSQKLL